MHVDRDKCSGRVCTALITDFSRTQEEVVKIQTKCLNFGIGNTEASVSKDEASKCVDVRPTEPERQNVVRDETGDAPSLVKSSDANIDSPCSCVLAQEDGIFLKIVKKQQPDEDYEDTSNLRCPQCTDFAVKSRLLMLQHLYRHADYKAYNCPECDLRLSTFNASNDNAHFATYVSYPRDHDLEKEVSGLLEDIVNMAKKASPTAVEQLPKSKLGEQQKHKISRPTSQNRKSLETKTSKSATINGKIYSKSSKKSLARPDPKEVSNEKTQSHKTYSNTLFPASDNDEEAHRQGNKSGYLKVLIKKEPKPEMNSYEVPPSPQPMLSASDDTGGSHSNSSSVASMTNSKVQYFARKSTTKMSKGNNVTKSVALAKKSTAKRQHARKSMIGKASKPRSKPITYNDKHLKIYDRRLKVLLSIEQLKRYSVFFDQEPKVALLKLSL